MLQNGTCINKVKIDKPHRLITATTITTQLITAVTSSQFGGATISLSHLAPFVRDSYNLYLKKYKNRGFNEDDCIRYAKEDLKKEVEDAVQTFNYQCNSMTTTNGQSPFLSVAMYLGETDFYKEELAMLIEEFLHQRIVGLKNEVGVYVTQAFPKLLYFLEEDNMYEDSKYWYLTKLAAECTKKRMTPDYISEKKMLEYKVDKNGNGNVYPCMGCVDGQEIISYTHRGVLFTESFERMWNRLIDYFEIKEQTANSSNLYMNVDNVKIYDMKEGFVEVSKVIRNIADAWVDLHLSDGKRLLCTPDHPITTTDNITKRVDELTTEDKLYVKSVHNEHETDSLVCKCDISYDTAQVMDVTHVDRTAYSYDVTTASSHFNVSGIYSHNCRSFLTPYINENGNPQYYGRFNQGVVTINLVDVALSSGGDFDTFWEIFDERMELCHKALKCRHERLEGTVSDVAPVIWQDGAFARLNKGEKIDKLLHNGYSTISLGYAGLYECVKYMTGHSHTDGDIGEKFGLQVMQALNNKCNQWKEDEHIDYSPYGTPMESGVYKFAKCLRNRFGVIEGITDRDYITNSYHIPVFEEIDPFKKLALESKFQKLSGGGAISYIECADLTNNTDAVIEVIKFIYDNIMYAELNTKSDYCQVCGYDGEIKIITDNNDLVWECPKCGNRDKTKMNVARRTCGYIGTNFWNKGRTEEIMNRYVHLDDHALQERG